MVQSKGQQVSELNLKIFGGYKIQDDFIWDLDPGWILFNSGAGAGKTVGAARKMILMHAYNDQSMSLIIAPTNDDINRLCVPEMRRQCEFLGIDMSYSGGNNDFKFQHILLFGRPIILISAETPERITGFNISTCWIEEGARIGEHDDPTRNVWTQVPLRLRCPKAKVFQTFITSTPEGTLTYLYKQFFREKHPNHRLYIAKTTDNPFITPKYIEDLRLRYPPELIDQYINGIPVDYSASRAHPGFFEANCKTIDLTKSENQGGTWHIGCDFNVNMMSWVLGYQIHGDLYIIDETIIEKDAQVDQMVHECHKKGWANHRKIHLHVDKSSKSSRTTSDSEFKILWKTGRSLQWDMTGSAEGANPEVSSRINVFNSVICNALGQRRFFVDKEKCPTLIKFLYGHPRLPNGNYSKKPIDPNILDAAGYMVWSLYRPDDVKPFLIPRYRA